MYLIDEISIKLVFFVKFCKIKCTVNDLPTSTHIVQWCLVHFHSVVFNVGPLMLFQCYYIFIYFGTYQIYNKRKPVIELYKTMHSKDNT